MNLSDSLVKTKVKLATGIPAVHLGDNDFEILDVISVALVEPLDDGRYSQFS